ncbi:MAG: hypothetical protein ABR598_05480 [Candidatus Dormibacteria bacterium]
MLTDIVGSTSLWQADKDAMAAAIALHDLLIASAVASHRGRLIKRQGEGDSTFSVFKRPVDAVGCAVTVQRALRSEPWQTPNPIAARIAVHSGEAERRGGDFFGTTVNRCARLRALAQGGQVLVSQVTEELSRHNLPQGLALRDLGVHMLRDLDRAERVYQVTHPDLADDFAPLRSVEALPNNLPPQLSSFIGRQQELIDLRELLRHHRLLTIAGAGGAGKTRLAIQLAVESLEDFAGGTWFIDLAPVNDARMVIQAAGSAVRLALPVDEETPMGGRRRAPAGHDTDGLLPRLIDRIRGYPTLLIFDNSEHLLQPCADLVQRLLAACPELRIVITGREPLGVNGEHTYRVPSLPVPALDLLLDADALRMYDSVRLFIERAAAARPGFTVNNSNAPAVAQICQRLDGIPLALELAAARVRVLTPEQICARLDDRFRLLTGGSRTALPRQQTLQALVDWSYQLLSSREQVLLQRLCVFLGGLDLAAAEAVGSGEDIDQVDVLDLMTQLVDKSMIAVAAKDDSLRYRPNETVRQYGLEKLLESGAASETRDRHAYWVVDLLASLEEDLRGPTPENAWRHLDPERDNVTSALNWLLERDPPKAQQLASIAGRFWLGRGPIIEGLRWLKAVLDVPDGAVDARYRASALTTAASLATADADNGLAADYAGGAADLFRDLGDDRGLAEALDLHGINLDSKGAADGRRFLEEALPLARDCADRMLESTILQHLGHAACIRGLHTTDGVRYFSEAAVVATAAGAEGRAALSKAALANLAIGLQQLDRARLLQDEILAVAERTGRLGLRRTWAMNEALFSREAGNPERTAEMLLEVRSLSRRMGSSPPPSVDLMAIEAQLEAGHFDDGRSLIQELLATGPARDRPAPVLNLVAYALMRHGMAGEARPLLVQAVEAAMAEGTLENILMVKHSLAECMELEGRLDDARRGYVEILGLADADTADYPVLGWLGLSTVALALGDAEGGARNARAALDAVALDSRVAGAPPSLARCILHPAGVAAGLLGHQQECVTLLSALPLLWIEPFRRKRSEEAIAVSKAQLGSARAEKAARRGAQMQWGEAADMVRSLFPRAAVEADLSFLQTSVRANPSSS